MTDFMTELLIKKDAQIAFDYLTPSQNNDILFVFINGFQRTRRDFISIRKKIKIKYNNIGSLSIDNRGTNESIILNFTQKINIELFASDAIEIINAIYKKFNYKYLCILGISMGGMIAQVLGAYYSNLLKDKLLKLFLVSTTYEGNWRNNLQYPELPEFWLFNNIIEIKDYLTYFVGSKFLLNNNYIIELLAKNLLKELNNPLLAQNALVQKKATRNFNGEKYLKQITCYTKIISGSDDKVIIPQLSHNINNKLKNSELIIYQHIGHMILLEYSQDFFNDIMYDF